LCNVDMSGATTDVAATMHFTHKMSVNL